MTRKSTAGLVISGVLAAVALLAVWLGHFARTGEPFPQGSAGPPSADQRDRAIDRSSGQPETGGKPN